MRLILLGPPGAGKGTQGQVLVDRLGIPRISTGDMLRDAAERGTEIGRIAKGYTDQGLLVPDATIMSLVTDRLAAPDAGPGYLMDGFPRTVAQAEQFRTWLEVNGQRLNAVVDLRVADETIVRRISERRVCPACHETYHLMSRPPRQPDVCDDCGHALVQRDDDQADLVRARLRVYHESTAPVTDYYEQQGLLIAIEGDRAVEEVTTEILHALAARNVG